MLVGTIEIDRCDHCAGAFFDPGEAAVAFGPEADPAAWAPKSQAFAPDFRSAQCPDGHGPMWRYDIGERSPAHIHACGRCRGLWLDADAGRQLVAAVRAASPAGGPSTAADEPEVPVQPPGIATYVFQALTGMPIEVWNPVKRRPWLVWSLALSVLGVFLYQYALQQTNLLASRTFIMRFGVVPVELYSGYGFGTLVTHAFLHGGWGHLLSNTYFLLIFGDNVEDRLGRVRFLILYFVAAIAGALAYTAFEGQSMRPMIGASGAISGVMGAYMVLFPRVRLWVVILLVRFRISVFWYLVVWTGVQVVLFFAGVPGVAWMAHIGGLAAGVLLGLLFRRTLAARAA